jgi:tRNA threonylcarbamoyladenosine biosynthesis protein TsaB
LNTLIIDTSTNTDYLGIATDTGFFEDSVIVSETHSSTIFKNMDELLSKANLNIKEINFIIAGIGPGSFTGIRICVSTVRMLAQILNIPITGIFTHDMIAASAELENNSLLLTAFDAKKGRVFGSLHEIKEDNLNKTIVKPGDYEIEEILKHIGRNANIYCIGNGSALYSNKILEHSSNAKISEEISFKSQKIIQFVNSGSLKPQNYAKILPYYARKSDAEIAKEASKSI